MASLSCEIYSLKKTKSQPNSQIPKENNPRPGGDVRHTKNIPHPGENVSHTTSHTHPSDAYRKNDI